MTPAASESESPTILGWIIDVSEETFEKTPSIDIVPGKVLPRLPRILAERDFRWKPLHWLLRVGHVNEVDQVHVGAGDQLQNAMSRPVADPER